MFSAISLDSPIGLQIGWGRKSIPVYASSATHHLPSLNAVALQRREQGHDFPEAEISLAA
jgi:hypothetical protein